MLKMYIISVIVIFLCEYQLTTATESFESPKVTRNSETSADGIEDLIDWPTILTEMIRTLELEFNKQTKALEEIEVRLQKNEEKVEAQDKKISNLEANTESCAGTDNQPAATEVSEGTEGSESTEVQNKKIASLEKFLIKQNNEIGLLKKEAEYQSNEINKLENSVSTITTNHGKLIEDIEQLHQTSITQAEKLDEAISRLDNINLESVSLVPGGEVVPDVCKLEDAELAKVMEKEGTRVVRGKDWKWENQDGKPPGPGTIVGKSGVGWLRVKWDAGDTNAYRMGDDSKYDLKLAECQ